MAEPEPQKPSYILTVDRNNPHWVIGIRRLRMLAHQYGIQLDPIGLSGTIPELRQRFYTRFDPNPTIPANSAELRKTLASEDPRFHAEIDGIIPSEITKESVLKEFKENPPVPPIK